MQVQFLVKKNKGITWKIKLKFPVIYKTGKGKNIMIPNLTNIKWHKATENPERPCIIIIYDTDPKQHLGGTRWYIAFYNHGIYTIGDCEEESLGTSYVWAILP